MNVRLTRPARLKGFTLIEVMVAITLSLLVVAALATMFVQTSRSRSELEAANQQIENGRYALVTLTDDLQLAGYMAEFNPNALSSWLASPPAPVAFDKPNPCNTTLGSYGQPPTFEFPVDLNMRATIRLHIQGYNNVADTNADGVVNGADNAHFSCLSDIVPGTDVVVIRRASTCVNGTADCPNVAGAPYFQASTCSPTTGGTELSSADVSQWYRLDTNTGNLNRNRRNCTTAAPIRRYMTHIYFVARHTTTASACAPTVPSVPCVPTLKRAELGAGNAFSTTLIAAGIQNLQFEYGIDHTGTDGSPEAFAADPDTFDPPGVPAGPFANCAAHPVECALNWRNVMAVRIFLLARNTDVTPGYNDTKVYNMGTANVGPFNDAYKRHAYQTVVRLTNPAGRREL